MIEFQCLESVKPVTKDSFHISVKLPVFAGWIGFIYNNLELRDHLCSCLGYKEMI